MSNYHHARQAEAQENLVVDFKELRMLRRCMTENGKIMPARMTGFSRVQQRQLKKAIENARYLALLSYVVK